MSMKLTLPLPRDKKLTVLHRLEPGCLGPNGAEHIDAFCKIAEKQLQPVDADFVHWLLVPRFDKTLPETQYMIGDKKIRHEQAARYLRMFDMELDEFEEHYHEALASSIDAFLGH